MWSGITKSQWNGLFGFSAHDASPDVSLATATRTPIKAHFISRLVALVPEPRVNLTRFHGLFAPNSTYRARVTPAKRGRDKKIKTIQERQDQTPAERRVSMTWARRLKRVFDIDIETCSQCGGEVKIIASIEDPVVIRKILDHLDDNASPTATALLLPQCRAPPLTVLLEGI
jgi:hypothetical protein